MGNGSPNGSTSDTGLTEEEVVMPGMEFMMQCYEHELKHPIKNLVSGQLARSLLIQVRRNQSINQHFYKGLLGQS